MLTAIVLLLISYMVIQIAFCYNIQRNFKPKSLTDLPMISEIYWIPLASAVVFYYVRRTIRALAKSFLSKIVKDQNDEDLKQARIDKASLLAFKMFFYTISSGWGYLLYKDSDMMPSWLGG